MKSIATKVILFLLISGIFNLLEFDNIAKANLEENAIVMQIWPESALGDNAGVETEKNMPSRGDGVIRISDITAPSITIYKPSQIKDKTPAVVICPGGGYNYVTFNKEGSRIAEWLNLLGITGIVLKYHTPNQRDNAFKDIQRAIRVVRHNAEEWNIDSKQIGAIGFSAGGHLCARVSGDFENKFYEPVDELDSISCKPDFTILIYPAYLYNGKGGLNEEIKVTSQNPRTFLIQTQDDVIGVENSIYYYLALKKASVQSEMHIFPTGGHGYSMESDPKHTVSQWPKFCEQWLHQIGILQTNTIP